MTIYVQFDITKHHIHNIEKTSKHKIMDTFFRRPECLEYAC